MCSSDLVMLAQEIVTRFHSAQAAESALADFTNRARGGVPDDIATIELKMPEGAPIGIAALLRQAALVASASEANRLIEQGGIRVNSETVSDKSLKLTAGEYVLQVGKRKFVKVMLS